MQRHSSLRTTSISRFAVKSSKNSLPIQPDPSYVLYLEDPAHNSPACLISLSYLSCCQASILMAPLEAEWLIWAKRMRDEHDKQSAKIENLSKTLEKQAQEVTSSKTEQAALRAEHTSLKAELAKDKAAHATDMAERAQEIAILREQVQAMVEPGRNDAKTGLTSQPYGMRFLSAS